MSKNIQNSELEEVASWGLNKKPFQAIEDYSDMKKELRWLNSEHRDLYFKAMLNRFQCLDNQKDFNKYYKDVQRSIHKSTWDYLLHRKSWYIMPLNWEKMAQEDSLIVDLGCGDGDTVQRIISYIDNYWETNGIDSKKIHIIGIELNQSRVDNANKFVTSNNPNISFEFICRDIVNEGIKFENDYFDYAVVTAVIESLPDDASHKLLGEISRTTKKGLYIEDILEDLPGGYPRENLDEWLKQYNFHVTQVYNVFTQPFDIERLRDPIKASPIMLVQNLWADKI